LPEWTESNHEELKVSTENGRQRFSLGSSRINVTAMATYSNNQTVGSELRMHILLIAKVYFSYFNVLARQRIYNTGFLRPRWRPPKLGTMFSGIIKNIDASEYGLISVLKKM
jgi:hypothetical protein